MLQETHTYRFFIPAAMCGACHRTIKGALTKAEQETVQFAGTKYLKLTTSRTPKEIIDAIDEVGFDAEIFNHARSNIAEDVLETQYRNAENIKKKTLLGFLIGLPMMILDMSRLLPSPLLFSGALGGALLGVISLVVMYYTGSEYFKTAWHKLLRGQTSMETLIALGTGTAWCFSLFVLLFPTFLPMSALHLYFAASIFMLAIVNLGKYILEKVKIDVSRERQQTIKDAIGDLPDTIHTIKQDDMLTIGPGECIPVDGILLSDTADIGRQYLYGETKLDIRTKHAKVASGEINHGTHPIKIKSDTDGVHSPLYSRLIDVIENLIFQKQAQDDNGLADAYAKWFVWGVILLAIVTGVAWGIWGPSPALPYILTTTISVLLSACPCVFGMASPVSIAQGMNQAMKAGIVVGDASLFSLPNITDIVFDKTGTLTQGKPTLSAPTLYDGAKEEAEYLPIIASLELSSTLSDHPYAQALIARAGQVNSEIKVEQIEYPQSCNGLSGSYAGRRYFVGNEKYMNAQGFHDLPAAPPQTSVLYVARDTQIIARYTVTDPLRDEIKELIAKLKKAGITPWLLTGGSQNDTATVAIEANIPFGACEVDASGKIAFINRLKKHGTIAYVGDYYNDFGPMQTAHISFALGSWLSSRTAKVTLKDSLKDIFTTLAIIKETRAMIHSNLTWSLIYNTFTLLFASGALYPLTGILLNPMIACVAMTVSSLFLLANTYHLRQNLIAIIPNRMTHNRLGLRFSRQNTTDSVMAPEAYPLDEQEAEQKQTTFPPVNTLPTKTAVSPRADQNSRAPTCTLL